jgi:uncharacterized protein (TIGR02996 family)
MVVLQVRAPGTLRWQQHRFATTFSIGSAGDCDLVLPDISPHHVRVVIDEPDVVVDCLDPGRTKLNGSYIDRDFVHVVHVGDVLELGRYLVVFELVTALPEDAERFVTSTGKHVLDATEQQLLDDIRAAPDDPQTLAVYADYLDDHERPFLAEFIRLQRLDRTAIDHSAFASKWLSAAPRAIELRLRDLAPLAEPWWRAIVSRPRIRGCGGVPPLSVHVGFLDDGCPGTWDAFQPTDDDMLRTCGRCKRDVQFCPTLEAVRRRSPKPLVFDPALVGEYASRAYDRPDRDSHWNIPTQVRDLELGDDD